MLVANRSEILRDTIAESFRAGTDGFWYPMEQGTPLVRIQFGGDGYEIQRRRNVASPWMPIVTANIAEFDATSFRLWRTNWPVVAAG